MKLTLALAALALLLGGCDKDSDHPVNPSPPARTEAAHDRDNTAVNTRDRGDDATTAGNAGQHKSDVELAADIRKKVTDTKMSVNAQNCKIVVQGGKVTLRGPVKSQEEKDSIAHFAADVVGEANVVNELEVESNP